MDKGYDFPDIRELVGNYGYDCFTFGDVEEENIRRDIPGYRGKEGGLWKGHILG